MIMYYSDFNSISERENFIVVYPQGSSFFGSSHWNVGGWTNDSSVNDVESKYRHIGRFLGLKQTCFLTIKASKTPLKTSPKFF